MIVFADLHLKESTEDVCFKVLAEVKRLAFADPDRRVVFCGDWWQLRYQVSVRLLNRVKAELHNWAETGLRVDLVPGNHDQVTVDGINALEVLAEQNIYVWTEPGNFPEDGFGFCPYRKDPVAQLEALKKAVSPGRTKIVFGHFAMRGAYMNNGHSDDAGLEFPWPNKGPRFKEPLLVLGHYHRGQVGPGYLYVGSPYQQSFGEAGNTPGVLRINTSKSLDVEACERIPLFDLAPRYFIVKWDVEEEEMPPAPPGVRADDKIRIDIAAPYSSLANPEIMQKVAKAGYVSAGAQVNVLPRDTVRDHKFELVSGESLGQAAERFVHERCPEPDEAEKRLECLRRWSGEEVGR
jgi:DNA repair exonuclease SbcCD nuclease subunit